MGQNYASKMGCESSLTLTSSLNEIPDHCTINQCAKHILMNKWIHPHWACAMRPTFWCFDVSSIKPSASKKTRAAVCLLMISFYQKACVCCNLLIANAPAYEKIPMFKMPHNCLCFVLRMFPGNVAHENVVFWNSRCGGILEHLSGRYWKSCLSELPSLSVFIAVLFHLLPFQIQTCLYAFLPCFTVSSSFIWSCENSAPLHIFLRPLLTVV